jgi:hypothetical protein
MKTGTGLVAALLSAAVASGCGATRQAAAPSVRTDPAIVLCSSQRSPDGGIRLVAFVEPGIYPITRAAIEYRTGEPGDLPPTMPDATGKDIQLAGARSDAAPYDKGSREIPYRIGPAAVRDLGNKVIWYRWSLEYDRNGKPSAVHSPIHRSSALEAGLPRAPDVLGPDASIALPDVFKR